MRGRGLSIWVILVLILISHGVLVGVQHFFSPDMQTEMDGGRNLLNGPWPETLSFSGERVPLDTFHVRERWEKEFLVALARDYQNILYLKRAAKYLPFIESELKARNLPEDFKYLALAESALINNSVSSAGAAGIWQIMPGTARGLGLRVDDEVDERYHFEKSTRAALNYLESIYKKFNNWTLTAAAYNVGFNKVLFRLETQRIDNYYDLYFNPETSAYLFRILAIKTILEYPEKYGYALEPEDAFEWPSYEIRTVGSVEDLASWAWESGSSYRLIKALNPWMRAVGLPDGEWEVKWAPRAR